MTHIHDQSLSSKCDCPVCRASAKDVRWFARHPHRSYRLRRATPCEIGVAKPPAHVPHVYTVVRQLVACSLDPRTCLPLVVATDRPFHDRSEQIACDVWHVGAEAVRVKPEMLAAFDRIERRGRGLQ
jgi:hypothetical protein